MVSKYINFRPQLVFAEQSAGSAVVLTTEQKLSLYKKSQKSGISTDVLEEVYQRGYTTWNESFGQTAEQFAFDRVNSFIAGGFAAELDEDLMNEEKKGLWANIQAKRKRIESGSGERMRKPGSEGAPTNAALKASQTNEDKDPCWDNYKQVGMKKKGGKQVPNCVPEETAEKQSKNPNEPSSRFMGTTSLTNIYKEATPGQMKESNTLSTIKRVLKEQTPDWSRVKAAFRKIESGSHQGDYSVPKPKGMRGSASGAYAFTDQTWRGETRRQGVGTEFRRAVQAPPEVQDKVMRNKLERNYRAAGGDANPQASLRAVVNTHFTGNPAGRMSQKAIKNNRGVTADTYYERFQNAMESQPAAKPKTAAASTPSQAQPRAATTAQTSATDTGTRTVRRGDTLSSIAKSSGLDVAAIQKLNPDIKDINKIGVGQQIRLRAAEAPKAPETPKTETPKAAAAPKTDYTLGSSPRTGLRASGGALTPEVTKKPEGKDYTLGSQRTLQKPEEPKQPGVTVADPNTDLGDQIRRWMQPQVDRMIAARKQSQTPATPRAPAVLSPKPLTKTQEAERDAEEKNTAEKAAADQAVYRGNVDTGQRGMPLPKGISDFLKDITPKPVAPRTQRDIDAATVRNSPPGSTVGSRYGAEGPNDDSEAAKKKLNTIKEAVHQGRKVTLNKPFRTPGGPKKSAVYVDPDGDGKAKIVRFGDPKLSIKKDQPGRKKSYCARSGGQGNLTKKDSANYWSRKAWDC